MKLDLKEVDRLIKADIDAYDESTALEKEIKQLEKILEKKKERASQLRSMGMMPSKAANYMASYLDLRSKEIQRKRTENAKKANR